MPVVINSQHLDARQLIVKLSRDDDTAPGLLRNPLFFSVPPIADLDVAMTFDHQTFQTIGKKTKTRPTSVGLHSVVIESMLCEFRWPFDSFKANVEGPPPNPFEWIDEMEKLGASLTPFRLQVYQPAIWPGEHEIDWVAVLVDFHRVRPVGEMDTWRTTCTFQEAYDQSGPGRRARTTGRRRNFGTNSVKKELPRWLLISALPAADDSLYRLAKEWYGEHAAWKLIAQHPKNRIRFGPSDSLRNRFHKFPKKRIYLPARRN